MSDACNREFKVDDVVYIVDYGNNQAIATKGQILSVDEEKKTFTALLYGDTHQRYKFEDYGRLFFDESEEAEKAIRKLPKPGTAVYQVNGKKVYKKTAIGIGGAQHIDGTFELMVYLDRGNEVPFKRMGSTLFLNQEDARRNIK